MSHSPTTLLTTSRSSPSGFGVPSSPSTAGSVYNPSGKFSENELRMEKLLPLLVDYSIEFTSAVHSDIHRSVVFEGGKLMGNIIMKPSSQVFDIAAAVKYQQQVHQSPLSFLDRDLSSPLTASVPGSNTSSDISNGYLFTTFTNIFDIKPDKDVNASAEEYLPTNNLLLLDEKQRELLLTKAKKTWKDLFSKLHIKTYISSRFPESVKSTTPSSSGASNSATSIDIKYFDASKEFIDFYLFKSNFVAKQAVNSQSIFMEMTANEYANKGYEMNDQDQDDRHIQLTFPFNIDIPFNDLNRNPFFVISEIFIPSDQFSDSMVRSLADVKSPFSMVNNFDLDFLVSYDTSQQYIPSRIFLCALCKPIALRKSLKLTSKTKLMNMKNYIQLVLENSCESQTIKIEKIELNLANAKFCKYCTPGDTQQTLVSNADESQLKNTTTANHIISPPPNAIYDLFNCFIEKSQFPLELKPFEQFTANLLVSPIYRNMDEIIEKLQNRKPITNLFFNTMRSFNSNSTDSTPSNSNSLVWDDSLGLYKSRIEVTYSIKNVEEEKEETSDENNVAATNQQESKHSTRFKSYIDAPWIAVLKRGLFASIKYDKQSVALMEPFTVSIFLSNFGDSDCDLILSSQPTAKSSIICQDAQIDVGIVKPSQSTKVVLHYIGVQQGLHHMDLLCIYNKRTQQQFIFPFFPQVIITK
ncbi:hypothetical protein C9374_002307 [Naegleria lovaniensis]|uniref:Trafficking protein particle complex subunit 13 C-terminal domain-containing protein n=1 Tax=Naegleria lovaniensis TaxID=51637 RepID=A0AA88GV69_NAELO|nr:uncharacterized protein C9374_002307 [Naegleria lovaniensis]KAG2386563.1 hypothetical protein C9374_002307 [Naegleria lovaniensis]